MLNYDSEIEIPFDVLDLDGFMYLVPHGLHIEADPIIKAGVFRLEMANRNITVSPVDMQKKYETHPKLPADEFFYISGTWDQVVIYSTALLNTLDITIESMYNFYSKFDKRLEDVDPSQLTVRNGCLCIGNKATEDMVVVWTGHDFIVTPAKSKLPNGEISVTAIDGSVTGNKFRCKYGMLDYRVS